MKTFVVLLFAATTLWRCYDAWKAPSPFDSIVSHKWAEQVNKESGNILILAAEPQDRFYMNENVFVVSLDGVVDNFFDRQNPLAWFRKCKPDFYYPEFINQAWYRSSFLNLTHDTTIGTMTFSKCAEIHGGNPVYKVSYK